MDIFISYKSSQNEDKVDLTTNDKVHLCVNRCTVTKSLFRTITLLIVSFICKRLYCYVVTPGTS